MKAVEMSSTQTEAVENGLQNSSFDDSRFNPAVSQSFSSTSEPIAIDPGQVILRLFRLLSRYPKTLFYWVLAGSLVFVLVSFLIPVQFESTAQLMPPDQMNSSSGLALLSALSAKTSDGLGLVSDLFGMKSNGAMFMGILRSRTVQDALVSQFDLRKVYSLKYKVDARKKLARRTDISEDHKSGIITITVSDHDARRAAAMAQAYVNELNNRVALLSTSSARRERVFLEERLKEVNQSLSVASIEFSQFSSKNTAIDIPAQGKAMVESAAQLQGELIAVQSELSGLQQIYSDNNVRVRSLKAKVEELRKQLDAVGGKNLGSEGSGTDANNLYPSIRELPLLGVKYFDLYRKLKIQEALYEALTKQYELAKVEEAKEIPTVKVLDSPVVAEKKSFPPRAIIIVFGFLLSVCSGVACLAVKSRWSEGSTDTVSRIFIAEVSDHLAQALKAVSPKRFRSAR